MKATLFALLLIVAVAGRPAPAAILTDRLCPGTITNGQIACHRMICEGCMNAWYSCDDGWDYNWNVCAL